MTFLYAISRLLGARFTLDLRQARNERDVKVADELFSPAGRIVCLR